MSLRDKIAQNQAEAERLIVEVEPWGETIYAKPVTAGDVDHVARKYKDFLSSPSLGAMVELIIRKAEDKDGERIFTLEDKPLLMREPISVIASVFGAILKVDSVEDHEKN